MAKSTRSSTSASKPTSKPTSKSPATLATKPATRRAGTQYGLGGGLVALLVLLLSWWLNGSAPTGNLPAPTADAPGVSTVAVLPTATASPVPTTTAMTAATIAPTTASAAVRAAPMNTIVPTATATAQPLPTATQPPKPTLTPTSARSRGPAGMAVITWAELPPEAQETLTLIEAGGPFPFSRDGITFQNREGLLPKKARGYYSEYTVITPGESDRGARRIIAGENGELYYTADHYASFAWIEAP